MRYLKTAVIFYHKNILSVYKKRWIDKCIRSIKNQTYKNFDVFELDYGGSDMKLCNKFYPKHKYYFYNKTFENHILAMNFLINKIFSLGYDVIFNTNMDDYFHKDRFKKQIKKIKEGYDLVSSNFCYIEENKKQRDIIAFNMNMTERGSIKENFDKGNNVIAHPCVCMSKTFWEKGLKYKNLIGYEDFDLWKRALKKKKKLFILKDNLLYYRIHEKQVTKENPVIHITL